MQSRLLLSLGLVVAATLAAPLSASAQDYDDHHEHTFVGRIVDTAPYNLQLDHGPHIFLREGTVIRPRGLTLRNGMRVKVVGHRTERGFAADEVDLLRHRDLDHD